MTLLRQLPIPLAHAAAVGRADFIAGASNQAAVAVIDRWPDWPSPVTVLSGPAGSGKSHLARVFAERSGALIVKAPDLVRHDPLALAAAGAVVVEDADGREGEGLAVDETALFHLVNAVREEQTFLLVTAREEPGNWGLTLPDLLSRLRAAQPARLGPPDDDLLARVLVKLFADRQIEVDRNVIDYLLPRMERSFAAANRMVDVLDTASLSLGRRLTRPLVARLLQALEPED
ncbi:DnaA regulatory inactivator [Hartmannibacter diazotrophicus]|uniref:DnaA regulatory inactivator n=1 Tax=Hartmannibacter diazotrophicus TaxID=1482074 RepID=A0A2C9D813_9HYPH|nr:hypothetical protein [Hartmannibacter diazotrophicus]SON56319.1 DnaA regulatory inactivator [Hartmannibacter diazotrophicus]